MLQVSDVRETRVFKEARDEGREEGRNEGREEGRKEGREQERTAIAEKMLEGGHSIDEISQITGLAVTQIRKLKKKGSGESPRSKK